MDLYKKSALIGYSGFVGTNLHLSHKFTNVYNSKNINEIVGNDFDIVVCCGISAMKWWANANPQMDMDNIISLLDILKTIKTKKFVLISTIDVYDNVNGNINEDTIINPNNNHAYGKNRYFVENFIINNFNDYHIIRLPGLFGYGLKKNIIYDFINDRLHEINKYSSFQWYDVGNLYNDFLYVLNNNIKLINLFPEPISNDELYGIFCNYKNCGDIMAINNNLVTYDVNTKYKNKYWDTKDNVVASLHNYIDNMLYGKLIISNLSWKHNDNSCMLNNLGIFGITQLEVSPHKYFSGDNNCNLYSFQSLLYPNTWNLFDDSEIVFDHFVKVIKLTHDNNVKVLVFGSPKNKKKNDLSYDDALSFAIEFFKRVSVICEQYNVIIVIEPNPRCYGCDFIINSIEGRQLVLAIDSKYIRLHLDFGCMYLENENILDCINNNLDILGHIHISAPKLENLYLWKDKINYREIIVEIKKVYHGYLSIEMINMDDYDILKDLYYLLLTHL